MIVLAGQIALDRLAMEIRRSLVADIRRLSAGNSPRQDPGRSAVGTNSAAIRSRSLPAAIIRAGVGPEPPCGNPRAEGWRSLSDGRLVDEGGVVAAVRIEPPRT